ncbi:exported hypothetical protein [Micromonospora lupini str. Lupac 08]|uniref:Uncharacterized protein n=1 Tax=Micromonospora lupini str. Lupac 08 TaxID=1150864 RepID=I0L449_9ACTN|nr:exported hypothetical protein [Micromonospora lupini str. Lupac 08]
MAQLGDQVSDLALALARLGAAAPAAAGASDQGAIPAQP